MDIFLIRHGECCNAATEHYDDAKKTMNAPLTQRGIMQAEKLAARCKTMEFDMVVSSDLSRAVQTAERIIAHAPCELSINPAFREIDKGEIYRKPWDEYPEIYAQWALHDQDIPYPGGENGEDVWNRCRPQLEELIASQRKRVAIVCHAGTIRTIICGILDIPQQKRFCFGAPPENGSISLIRHSEVDGKFVLQTFNDHSHIDIV